MAIDRCVREIPVLRHVGDSQVACHRAEEVDDLACRTVDV
jgi:hypothetical protein